MGDTTPNHSSNSEYEIPTFYSIGALDSLGGCWDLEVFAGVHDAGFCPSAADKAPGRHFGHRRVGPDSVPETQSHPESRNALFCQLASDDGDVGKPGITGPPPLRLRTNGRRDIHRLLHKSLHCGPSSDKLFILTELEAMRALFCAEDRVLNLATSHEPCFPKR